MKEKISYQVGIKLAIGTGDEGYAILEAIGKRAEHEGKTRNRYIVDLIKKDLASNGMRADKHR